MPEFQAIILAGGQGTRMKELTKKKPKCLLPIGGKPMLYHPVQALKSAGFKDVIVIVPDKNLSDIENEMKALFGSDQQLKIDFVPVSVDDQLGTAEALVTIKDMIVSDVLILSCDVIMDYPLIDMINLYRTHEPSLVTLLSTTNPTGGSRCYGAAKIGRGEKDLIALDVIKRKEGDVNRLIFHHSESDFGQSMPFSVNALNSCQNISVMSNWFDSHVYLLKKSALESLWKDSGVSSLKGEFISNLVDGQFTKVHEADTGITIFDKVASSLDLGDADHPGLYLTNKFGQRRCLSAVIRPPSFCIRANNIAGFLEANKKIAEKQTTTRKNCLNSIIPESSILNEASHIIRSVIGNNCTIGSHVKITDSVIFDGVIIEDGCIIQSTIVCSDAKIGRKSSLEKSVVSFGYQVHSDSSFVDEFLSDGTEGEFVVE